MKIKHLPPWLWYSCLILLCCLPLFLKAQTTIYRADFSSNGATSGNNWRVVNTTDCDQPGTFAASGGDFVINDMEGSGCAPGFDGANDNVMEVGPINVSFATCVRVQYTVAGIGIFESLGTTGGDFLDISIFADGALINPDIHNYNGPFGRPGPVSIQLPPGTNTVSITITGGNQSIDETYVISDVEVLNTTIEPTIPDIDACTDQVVNLTPFQSGIAGLWSGNGVAGTSWVTVGLNPGTYPLTFTPFDPCANAVTVTGTVSGGGLAGSASLSACGNGNTSVFDLTLADDDIQNGASGDVFWFTDILKMNPIANPTNYLANDGDIVYGAYQQGNCLSEAGELELNIEDPPTLVAPDDVEVCGSYLLPALPAGVSYQGFNEGDIILNDEIITIASGSGTCLSQASFEVTINSGPIIDAYTGATEACDSLLLPSITGTDLTGNEAYYTEPDGEGDRLLAGDFLTITGQNTFYMYDEEGACTNEVSFEVEVLESGMINARDTIVCDTFAFLPYQGTGNFIGYFSEKGGQGTQYNPGDGLKQDPGTVKVYVQAGTGTCVSEDSFNITFRLAPELTSLSAFDVCDTISLPNINGTNLSGNQAYYTMRDGQGSRILPGALIDTSSTFFIYDRIGSCPDELLFTVLVIPQPEFDPIPDQIVCDTFILPPISGTDLTGGELYSSGLDGTGIQFSPGDVLTTDQRVYLYDERARCTAQDSFDLSFNYRPQITGPFGDRLVCDTFVLPAITGGDLIGNEVITTAALGQGDTLQAGTIFTDSTILFLTAGNPGCLDTQQLRLFINPQPILDTLPDTLVCDFFILPAISGLELTTDVAYFDAPEGQGNRYEPGDTLRSTGTYFTFDQTEVGCVAADTFEVRIGLTPQLTTVQDTLACNSFRFPAITGTQLNAPVYSDGPLGTGTIYSPGDLLLDSLRLFIYDEDLGCFDSTSFVLRVLPQVDLDIPFRDTMVCDSIILEPLTGNNLTGNEGYFSQPLGMGSRFLPGTILRDSIVLYAYDGRETCIDTATILVNIQPTPQLDPLTDVAVCDFYVLPILTGQNLTLEAAYFDVNDQTRFFAGDTILISRTLEARDTNDFGCGTTQRIQVQVTRTPQLASLTNLEVCDTFTLEPIQGQFLPANTNYYTQANGNGQIIPVGTDLNSSQNIFIYADSLGCSATENFSLTVNYTPLVTNALSDSTGCYEIEIPALMGNNLAANMGYYAQPNGMGSPLNLPFSLSQDTSLYIFGNNGNCMLSDTIELQVKSIQTNLLITDSIECNGDLGRIEITDLSVEPPFTINWGDPNFFGLTQLTNIPAGIYTVLITDVNNCTLNQTIELSQPDTLLLNCSIIQEVSVPNGSDGQLELDFSGGVFPYTLLLSGARTDTLTFDTAAIFSLENLEAGTYDFTLTDANNCTESCSLEITAPPCLLAANLSATDISCHSFQNGTLELDITNAQAPLVIDWSVDSLDGQTSIINVAAGIYSVTVTDANACIDSTSATITEPAALQISGSEIQSVTNSTSGDGIVGIRFNGGVAPYTLEWNGPETGSIALVDTSALSIDSLIQGAYTFEIIDANACRISTSVLITNPNCGMTVSFIRQDQTCPNTTDGQLTAIVSGGVGPYTFLWSDGNTDSIRRDLGTGIYELQVLDSETCITQGIDTINISNPLPSLSFISNSIQCDSSCQELSVRLAGTAPFNFSWEQQAWSNNNVTDTVNGNSMRFSGDVETLVYCEAADSLSLTVLTLEDAFCSIRLDTTFGVRVLPNPTLLVTDTLCENDSLRIGSQLYTKNNPLDTILLSNQASNGCDSLIYVDLTFIDIVYDTLRQTLCQEDTLLINGVVYGLNNPMGTETFSGGGDFGCDSVLFIDLDFIPVDTAQFAQTLCRSAFLDIGDTRFDQNNPSGIARIEDAALSGCDSLISVEITFVDQFTSDFRPTICAEDSVAINGTIYNFLNPLGTEFYTAQSGCDSIVSIDLAFFPVDTQFVDPILCPGDSVIVNGIVYNENNPFAMQTIPAADTNGCNSIVQIDLTYLQNPEFDFMPTICQTDTIFVNGVAYHISNPSGLEILEDAAQNGCDSLVNVAVQFYPEIRTFYQDTLCNIDSLVVNGTSYNLANPTGIERLQGQGLNGCDSIVEIDLHFEAPITASLTGTTAICAGATTELTLALSGDSSYDILYSVNNQSPITENGVSNGDQISVQPMGSSTYQLLGVTGVQSACPGIVLDPPVRITVSELDVRISQLTNFGGFGVSCADANDGQVNVAVSGGIRPYNYTWNTGDFSAGLDNLSSGTYFVNIMDEVGCLGGDTVQLLAPPPLEVSWSSAPSICPSNPNGEITLNSVSGGTGNYELSLDGQFFTQILQIPTLNNGITPGRYEVVVQDDNDCQVATTLTVGEEAITLDLGPDIDLKIGDSIQLNPTANFPLLDFVWTPTTNLSSALSAQPFVSPDLTTAYTLTAVDISGCSITDDVIVYVDQTRDVFTPSVFTPDEDGINDRFTIFGGSDLSEIEVLQVFDRWGNLLYEARGLAPSNDQVGWDGKYRNNLVAGGTYVYRAVLRFTNGDTQEIKGGIALLR
ncbi:MAG: hypothetical protein Sapg2KO_50150 [Saprospiraceae bacterium]